MYVNIITGRRGRRKVWEREKRGKVIEKNIHICTQPRPQNKCGFFLQCMQKGMARHPVSREEHLAQTVCTCSNFTQKSGKIGYSTFNDDTIRHAFLHELEKMPHLCMWCGSDSVSLYLNIVFWQLYRPQQQMQFVVHRTCTVYIITLFSFTYVLV